MFRELDKERLAVFSDEAGGTMAEVGLLPFARVALQVATQVLPPYRTRFSKHQFTQPQLLAVLCLMRYEDWTFREAEVRLREHQELRAVLKLPAVPDYTTLYRFLRRLEDDTVDRGLQETVLRLRRRRRRPITAAIDGTGLSDTSVSTFFHRRLEQQAHGARPRRPWLKWLIVADVRQQILLAQRAGQARGCDTRSLPGLLDVAARGAPIGVVLADAEFDSEANHEHIRQRLGAKSIIPARRRGVPNGAIRNQMFRAFPKKPYRQRAKIESIFSAVKRKLSSRAPGRSLATQVRQALLLGLAYNLYRLRHRTTHRGCQQSPSVANKRLTAWLNPLDATLTKNRGYRFFRPRVFSLSARFLDFQIESTAQLRSRDHGLVPTSYIATCKGSTCFSLSPVFRTLFQVPYPVTSVFATLTKTAGVCTNNSHSGTGHLPAPVPLPYSASSPLPPTACATLKAQTPMNRGSGLRIGKILGIPIYLHSTWVFIFAAITYIIASQFKQEHPGWTDTQHWTVGVLTSLLFFASVLFHELSHSVVAQHYKIRVVSITLFLFGGLARIEREPSKAIQEFNIAIAGPLASGFLAAGFFGLTKLFPYSQTVGALATWLSRTNLALAVFNLLPGFPLDGGRIFRAMVWGVTKNFEKATRVAGASGKLIAYAIILGGAWGVVHGNVQMLWTFLIGWFILNAAQESVAQVAVRQTLAGLSAADVMSKEVPTAPGHITLEEYGAEVLRTGRRYHLILSDDRLVGMMNVQALNAVPREEWAHNSVQAAMIPREKILWTSPEEPLLRLLERLLSADVNQMPVVSGATDGAPQIVGIVTRDSILRVMQTRSELGPLAATK